MLRGSLGLSRLLERFSDMADREWLSGEIRCIAPGHTGDQCRHVTSNSHATKGRT